MKTQFTASVCTKSCHFSSKKTAKYGRFFGQKLIFLASAKQLKTPFPYCENAGCGKACCRQTQVTKTKYTASVCTKICHVSCKNGQTWPFFGQNLSLFASDKQLKTPPPILRVLDAKKQVVEAYRSRKHNLQHPYAPKVAIFHEKMAKNGCFLVKN